MDVLAVAIVAVTVLALVVAMAAAARRLLGVRFGALRLLSCWRSTAATRPRSPTRSLTVDVHRRDSGGGHPRSTARRVLRPDEARLERSLGQFLALHFGAGATPSTRMFTDLAYFLLVIAANPGVRVLAGIFRTDRE